MLVGPPDQGPQTAGGEQQDWHGRSSVGEVFGPGLLDPLSPAVWQLNLEVGCLPVPAGVPAHADNLPTVRMAGVADPDPIRLSMMANSIMLPPRRRRRTARSCG